MTTAVEVAHTSKLPDQITQDRIELWKRTFCKGASNDELSLFIEVCRRTGLSPEARQIYMVPRYDSKLKCLVMGIQTSIDGSRLVAERSGKYAGQLGPYWCGPDGDWKDVWLEDNYPSAAKVGVLRSDFKEPLWAVARWDSYVVTYQNGDVSHMWNKMAEVMIAKCAESLALRKGFPQELSGIYTEDEMGQAAVKVDPLKDDKDHSKAMVSRPTELTERHQGCLTSFVEIGISKEILEKMAGGVKAFADLNDMELDILKKVYVEILEGKKTAKDVVAMWSAPKPVSKLSQLFSSSKSSSAPGTGK